jgi:hypothetical protein
MAYERKGMFRFAVEEHATLLEAESERWEKAIRAAGLRID